MESTEPKKKAGSPPRVAAPHDISDANEREWKTRLAVNERE
jgi:hypothetical protein